jgi:hypothetical protein
MTTVTTLLKAALGASLLAVPMLMATPTAHADNVRVSVNFGAPVYRPAPVAVRYVPVPAPVVVRQAYVVPARRMAWHGPRHDWRRQQAWNWRHERSYPVAYRY